MKRVIFLFMLVLTLFAEQHEIYIAVNDFVALKVDSAEARIISNKIRNELQIKPLFKVMVRSEMSVIMEEMQFHQSEYCSDEACAVEMGKMFGVEKIVTGTIGKVGGVYSITMKMIDIESSELIYSSSKEFKCPIEELLTIHAAAMSYELEQDIHKKICVSISVKSKPKEIDLFLNGQNMGPTPFTSTCLPEGQYNIELFCDNYNPIRELLELKQGDIIERNYILEYTKAYADSLFKINSEKRRKRQMIRRIAFGAAAAGSLGMGIYFNNKANTLIEEQDALMAEYNSAVTGHEELRNAVLSKGDEVDNALLARNICYGATGGFSIAFALSFPF